MRAAPATTSTPPPAPAVSTTAAGALSGVLTSGTLTLNGNTTYLYNGDPKVYTNGAIRTEQPSPKQPAEKDVYIAELRLYDAIGADFFGDGITAKAVALALEQAKGASQLLVMINSPGGDVFEATAIHSVLSRFPAPKCVVVDGLAASAASYVAMVGDTIAMAPNAMMMIHNPWGFAVGSAADMRDAADLLDKVGGTLVATYAKRSGQSEKAVASMMADETWMTAAEALDLGFTDKIGTGDDDNDAGQEPDADEDDRKAAASARSAAILNKFTKTPKALRPDARALIASMEKRASPPTPAPAAAKKS